MKTFTLSLGVAILVLNIPAMTTQPSLCGVYEEGTSQTLTCSTQVVDFTRFGPRIKEDGLFREMSYCDSNGNCHSIDPSRFRSSFSSDPRSSRKRVTLYVHNVTREMTAIRCYRDGHPVPDQECQMVIYVKPDEPQCTGPEFVDHGTAIALTCTADRIYPKGACLIQVRANHPDIEHLHKRPSSSNETRSTEYPGDSLLTCHFRLKVSDLPESRYSFSVGYHPRVPGFPMSSLSTTDSIPQLDLKSTAFLSSGDTSQRELFDLETGQLQLNLPVVSSPPPNRYSLTLKPEEGPGPPVPVPSQYYTVTYNVSSTSSRSTSWATHLEGIVQLTLLDARAFRGRRTGLFTFTAENGVVGSSEAEYWFTAERTDIPPTQPTCDVPSFVDGGAIALITCTADRIFPTGTCDFQLISDNLTLNEEPTITTATNDSVSYPGDKKVTCRLQVAVTGMAAGLYHFQVVITANNAGNQSTLSQVTTLTLKPTSLLDPTQNNHVFPVPDSGQLAIDVHVTGNPEPDIVRLWLRQDEASTRVPVSGRDFQWSYVQTAGPSAGVLQLSVNASSMPGSTNTYILKAENGVSAENGFEYQFTIGDIRTAQKDSHDNSFDRNVAIIIIAAAGGLFLIGLVICLMSTKRDSVHENLYQGGKRPNLSRPNMSGGGDCSGYIYPSTINTSMLRPEGHFSGQNVQQLEMTSRRESIPPEPVYCEPFELPSGEDVYCEPFDLPSGEDVYCEPFDLPSGEDGEDRFK